MASPSSPNIAPELTGMTRGITTDGGGDAGWSDADDVSGDIVLEQSEVQYDEAGNPILDLSRQRFHDATGTGALGTPSSGIGARVSYSASYYDDADRLTDSVSVGTNGGSAWSRPGTVPSRSDTVLVSSYEYDSAGNLLEVTDPKGIVSRSLYDDLGRIVRSIEAYVDGTPSDADDRITDYTYDGIGNVETLKAVLPGGAFQETKYIYGVSQSTGSTIDSNDILLAVWYPDKTTGSASSGEAESFTVNAVGDTVTRTDRNGNVHTFSYDVLGRLLSDAVTTLGSGVDGAVRRIETSYNTQGLPYNVSSYNDASGGSIVNQVRHDYNGFGQLAIQYQAINGAANTTSTPKVQYGYSSIVDGSRLVSLTYPNGQATGV